MNISLPLFASLGFGADMVYPVRLICHGCPIEPWTYVKAVQGITAEDIAMRWIAMDLIASGSRAPPSSRSWCFLAFGLAAPSRTRVGALLLQGWAFALALCPFFRSYVS